MDRKRARVSESASATVRVMKKGSHLFVVENYSRHKGIGVDESIDSKKFLAGGRRWKICFYPAGRTADANKAGFASLYIYLNSQVKFPVPFLFAAHLLDQSGRGNDLGESFFEEEKKQVFFVESNCRGGCSNFVKRESVESSDYLKDDCLKISVTIGVLSSQTQTLPLIKVPKSNMGEDFGKLLHSKKGVDVFFKVKNESFCAHKWMLASRCPKLLLSSHSEIDILDTEPYIFEAMLWFVYTRTLPKEKEHDNGGFSPLIIESFMGKMLAAADRFELKGLKKKCESRISKIISTESVAYVLHLAELCHSKELKAACLRFGTDNGASILDVMDNDGYKYLRETCPLLFLELAYKGGHCINDTINGCQKNDLYKKIFSAMKETFAGILRTECVSEEKHKIKGV